MNKQRVSDSYLHNNGVMRCYHVCAGGVVDPGFSLSGRGAQNVCPANTCVSVWVSVCVGAG